MRQYAALDEGGAPDATALFVPENSHRSFPYAFDRLDRRDDAERAVELSSVGDRVEVRACPDARLRGPADEVPGLVHLDLEPGLTHPPGRQLVSRVLAAAAANAVGTDPAADGVELVKPLVDPHAAIIPLGRDSTGHVPVPGTGTTL